MTEKKLRYFIMVAECENISQAAGKLYIAQSALSKIIGGMEEELGYFLFDRIGKLDIPSYVCPQKYPAENTFSGKTCISARYSYLSSATG